MFQVRPPFPWLHVSPEDEERQLPGFNVQSRLLAGFIRAAQASTGNGGSFPTDPFGVHAPVEAPQFGTARWPSWLGSEDSDPPWPEYRPELPPGENDEDQDIEIQVPSGISGSVIDTVPQLPPPPPSRPPPSWPVEPWPEPTTDPEKEEVDSESVPIPAPWPYPAPPAPMPPPPLPRTDPVAEAMDQLARIYGLRGTVQRVPGPPPLLAALQAGGEGDRSQGDFPTTPAYGIDPRYIVPTAGWRFPKGPRGPSRPQPPSDNWKRPPRNHNNPPGPPPTSLPPRPPKEPLNQLIELILRIGPLLAGQDYDPFADMEVPPGGIRTRAGVRMHPDLPEPAAGRDYLPRRKAHRRGYKGELILANRVAMEAPGEIVIHYGNRAGVQGPDIITVNRQGRVFILDSKWRTRPRGITENSKAHPNLDVAETVELLLEELLNAYKRGQISGALYRRSVEEVRGGNFSIGTIGTGNAYDGVVQDVVNGVVGPARRIAGPTEEGAVARIFEEKKP